MRISDWSSDVCSSDLGKSEFFDRHLDDCKARFGGERIEGLVCRLILTAFRIIFDEACADFAVVISGCAKGRERFVDRLADAVLAQREHMVRLDILMTHPIGRAECRERVCQYG